MKIRPFAFCWCLLGGSLWTMAATLPVSEDSDGYRGKLTAAANVAATLRVDGTHRAYLYFDLTELPVGASIRYARLRMYLPSVVRAGSGLEVHVVTGEWDESVAGLEPQFDASPLTTVGPGEIGKKRFISVDVTDVVQGWLNDASSNEGFAVTVIPGVSSTDTASVSLSAKEGSGSGYPAVLEVELHPVPVAAGAIGTAELAPNLTLGGTTSGSFSGNGSALTNLDTMHLVGQLTNAQLANSGVALSLGPGLSGSNAVNLGGTITLNNTGVLSLTANGGITVSAASGDVTLGSNGTSENTAGTLVMRSGNGGFNAGPISATSFQGDGSGLTNLPVANLTGVISAGQLANNLTLGGTTTGSFSGTFVGNGAGLTNVVAVNGVAAQSLVLTNHTFMEFVRVGSPGNASDPATGSVFGAVATTFLIGKYEVTNAQYVVFLNAVAADDPAGLYNAGMATSPSGGITRSGLPGSYTYGVRPNMGDKPVTFVSFFDAVRFCNWMHNGMPIGTQNNTTTENGAYLITASAPNWVVSARQSGARFYLPNENEWYKAAYFDPDKGSTGGYWLYASRSSAAPTIATADATGNISNATSNVANYNYGADWNGQHGNITTVGSGGPGSESAFGACDMGGNVWEWLETIVTGSSRELRNGSWNAEEPFLRSTFRDSDGDLPTVEKEDYGFRVARP